jgi:hypothetical protein
MKVFLAFSFRPQDKELVSHVERLLASHDVLISTGERVGGEQLTPSIKIRIEEADGLIAVLTRRDQLAAGGWTTHSWVRDELAHARAKGKKAIALVEEGVEVQGMQQPHEHLVLKPGTLLENFLGLSETVAIWRADIGRTVKVQILPPVLAHQLGSEHDGMRCRHRLGRQGNFTEWQEVPPVPEVGGTFVYIRGVREDHLIQLEVTDNSRKRWRSVAASQWMQVELAAGSVS